MADVNIWDRRQVLLLRLPDGLISHTPKGNKPIRCTRAELTYDIPTGQLGSGTVWGVLTEQRDLDARARSLRSYGRERAGEVLKRGYHVDWKTRTANVPDWLATYIDQYQPPGPSGEDNAEVIDRLRNVLDALAADPNTDDVQRAVIRAALSPLT